MTRWPTLAAIAGLFILLRMGVGWMTTLPDVLAGRAVAPWRRTVLGVLTWFLCMIWAAAVIFAVVDGW